MRRISFGLLLALGLALAACGKGGARPEIVADILVASDSAAELETRWAARVRERFSIGIPEAQLTHMLRRQGFRVRSDQRHAAYIEGEKGGCMSMVALTWDTDGSDKVIAMRSSARIGCE